MSRDRLGFRGGAWSVIQANNFRLGVLTVLICSSVTLSNHTPAVQVTCSSLRPRRVLGEAGDCPQTSLHIPEAQPTVVDGQPLWAALGPPRRGRPDRLPQTALILRKGSAVSSGANFTQDLKWTKVACPSERRVFSLAARLRQRDNVR